MKKKLIVFRASDKIVERMERLVDRGIYRNKTEIINEALRDFLRLNQPNVNSRVKKE